MRLEDNYDWLVLGNHPAALLTASLVAKLGLSVLVLPMGSHLGFSTSSSGQPLDPEPNYLLGLGKHGEYEGLIAKCLRTSDGKLEAPSTRNEGPRKTDLKSLIQTCIPQVLTPQNRLAMRENDALSVELNREFGKDFSKQFGLIDALEKTQSGYLSFWQDLPMRLTWDTDGKSILKANSTSNELRKSLLKGLNSPHSSNKNDPSVSWLSDRKRMKDLEDWQEIGKGLWHAIASQPAENSSLFEFLQILSLSRTGASFRGGISAYRKYLIEQASGMGVHIPDKVECRRVFIDRGRFSGIQVTHRGSQISFSGGILGCTLKSATEKMSHSGTPFFPRLKKPLTPVGWRFTLGLTVRRESISEGMTSRAIWQEKEAPALELEVVDAGALRILYLRTILPFTTESLNSDYQRVIAGRMFKQAIEILPFLETHVIKVFPEFRMEARSGLPLNLKTNLKEDPKSDFKEVYGFETLTAIPENLLVFAGKGLGFESGIEGLLIGSDEAYPGLGNFGATVAALESVAWIAHRVGFPGPLV